MVMPSALVLMTAPSCLEAFFVDGREGLGQGRDERRRHRVVILSPEPVVLEQLQIEVVTRRFTSAP